MHYVIWLKCEFTFFLNNISLIFLYPTNMDIKRQINMCFFIFMTFMLIQIKFEIDVKTWRKFHSEVLFCFCFVLGTQQQTEVLGLSLARIRDCTFRIPKSGRYSQWFRKVQFHFFFFFNLLYLLLLLLLLSFIPQFSGASIASTV